MEEPDQLKIADNLISWIKELSWWKLSNKTTDHLSIAESGWEQHRTLK